MPLASWDNFWFKMKVHPLKVSSSMLLLRFQHSCKDNKIDVKYYNLCYKNRIKYYFTGRPLYSHDFAQEAKIMLLLQESHLSESSSSTGNQHIDQLNIGNYSASEAINLGMKHQDVMEKDIEQRIPRHQRATLAKSLGSSKDLMEAAEVTIKLLNEEAKMWENNTRKLLVDMERLQKDLCSNSDKEQELEMELSELQKECYRLKGEIEQLKTMVEESSMANSEKLLELKDEIEYHKRLNNDLHLQLKKSQKSNIELTSMLEELENTIERQKKEIIGLSMAKFQFQDGTDYSHVNDYSEDYDIHSKKPVLPSKIMLDSSESDLDISSSRFPIKCLYEGIELKEFWSLEMQEKLKNMEGTIRFLEKSLEEKDEEMLKQRGLMANMLEENEAKWKHRLFEKEQEIISIEKKLYEGIDSFDKKIRSLNQNMQELEEARTCKNPSETSKAEEEDLTMKILMKEVSDVYLLTQSSIGVGGGIQFSELDFQLDCWKEFCSYLEDELNKTRAHLKMQELANAALEDKLQRCSNFLRAEVPGESYDMYKYNAPVPEVCKKLLT